MKMPQPISLGSPMATPVVHYLKTMDSETPGEIFRYMLPPFQRPPVWSVEQKIGFIESMRLGLPLGTIVYTQNHSNRALDRLLIDGQQRLRALRDYFNNDFPVFGAPWAEVDEEDRLYAMRITLSSNIISRHDMTLEMLRQMYIAMNYGGSAHRAEDHPDVIEAQKSITKEIIDRLREETGCGMADVKAAFSLFNGKEDRIKAYLRQVGLAVVRKGSKTLEQEINQHFDEKERAAQTNEHGA